MPDATITIRADAKLVKKIGAIAASMDRSRNWVIEDALKRYIEIDKAQVEGIKEAVKSLDRGEEGIPHEQVMAEMDDFLAQYGVPPYNGKGARNGKKKGK